MKRNFTFIALAAALIFTSCAKDPQQVPQNDDENMPQITEPSGDVAKGWVRIRLNEDQPALRVGAFTRGESDLGIASLDAIAAKLGATEVKPVFKVGGEHEQRHREWGLHLWYDFFIDEAVPVTRAMTELSSLPEIHHAEPVAIIYNMDAAPAYVPISQGGVTPFAESFNDPRLSNQWHYHNTGSNPNSVVRCDIGAVDAWRKQAGHPDVIVAIIDGGVQWDHPDLDKNVWINEAEKNGNSGIDDDNNGYIDDLHGWNFHENKAMPTPTEHGTHVAGTVAAINNNGVGVAGVAGGTGNGDGVRLMLLQTLGERSGKSHPEVFRYAADNGAVIAQNSWGYPAKQIQPADKLAIDYFIANAGMKNGVQVGPMAGGIAIFACGNENTSLKNSWPAPYEKVMAVSAVSANYTRPMYSNYGDWVDISAPGGADDREVGYYGVNRVYSTRKNGDYTYMQGTSMACPHVSGVAALIVSEFGVGKPGFTAQQCWDKLIASARNIDEYLGDYKGLMGVGLVDASRAVYENTGIAPDPVTNLASANWNVARADLSWLASKDSRDLASAGYRIFYSTKDLNGMDPKNPPADAKQFFIPSRTEPGSRVEASLTGLGNGSEYFIAVYAEDIFNVFSAPVYTTGKTLDAPNRPPSFNATIADQKFEGIGEDFAREIDLSEYFFDPDGDEDIASYEASSNDPSIVSVTIDGSIMTLTPIANGESRITARINDRAGLFYSQPFTATVNSGTTPPPQPPVGGGSSISPNPATDLVNITLAGGTAGAATLQIYNSMGGKVYDGNITLNSSGTGVVSVVEFSAGFYTFRLDQNGRTYDGNFIKN